MATVLTMEEIKTVASLASGRKGLFSEQDAKSFACKIGDTLDVEDDFASALLIRNATVTVDSLKTASLTKIAKSERSAIFASFQRAARKALAKDDARYSLYVVTLANGKTRLAAKRTK